MPLAFTQEDFLGFFLVFFCNHVQQKTHEDQGENELK